MANLFAGLPWADGAFDLVTALEILEHLPPDRVPAALAELARVCGGYLYATIPSFGPEPLGARRALRGQGASGAARALPALGPEYRGPVPEADLAVDADGELVEGHLCIASFEWWTDRFAEAGFTRCIDVEAASTPTSTRPAWRPSGTCTCSGVDGPTRRWSSPAEPGGPSSSSDSAPAARHLRRRGPVRRAMMQP